MLAMTMEEAREYALRRIEEIKKLNPDKVVPYYLLATQVMQELWELFNFEVLSDHNGERLVRIDADGTEIWTYRGEMT